MIRFALMKYPDVSSNTSAVISELVDLYENVLSRVLTIQSVLLKKSLVSAATFERERKRIAKALAKNRERQLKKLLKRISGEHRKRLRRMLDKPVGPIQ